MNVQNVSSASSATDPFAALKSALQSVSNTSGSVGAGTVQTAAQENAETPAQTQAEAASGNQQAVQKLAQEKGGQAAQHPDAEAGRPNSLNAVA